MVATGVKRQCRRHPTRLTIRPALKKNEWVSHLVYLIARCPPSTRRLQEASANKRDQQPSACKEPLWCATRYRASAACIPKLVRNSSECFLAVHVECEGYAPLSRRQHSSAFINIPTSPTMLAANDTLSNILGWVSIACWIVVYSPQIYENYSLQSGEGLSVAFVVVWLLGDLCNLVGSAVAGLLPTVIIVAAYYTLCDSILLLQIYYYRWKKSSRLTSSDERAPLLATVNAEDVGLQQEQVMPAKALAIRYASASLFVCAAGVTAWWISSITTSDEEIPQHPRKALRWEIQAIGWTSAMLYLGARLPQILKNFKTRCAGLSPALFLFAILGNGTYGLSICAKSMDRRYLITNASWLAGSILTILLDVIVLCQFVYYRTRDRQGRTTPATICE
ncbi:putative vacuolar membrane transporter for cationic amino acids [Pleurotus ostreatus]|nr:putative vacuolar membrane transporter for cationic amino acids [Pleurotus ostreatus]